MRDVLWMQCASFVVVFLLQWSTTGAGSSSKPTLVIVDPFTEYISGHLKQYCMEQNPPIRVVELASAYTTRALNSQGMQIPPNFKIPDTNEDLETWAVNEDISLDPNDTYVLSESDCGTEDSERIATALGLVGNGPSPHLRNKYLANERLRSQGIPVVQQILANNWEDVENFLLNHLWLPSSQQQQQCVIKPYRGVASDGVFLCNSLEDAKVAFNKLHMHPQFGGGVNDKVLVQQYVTGTEYAVDTVARDGQIKVAALWRYRKLPCNDAPFVYQCSELVSAEGEEEASVCNYCVELLKGLGLQWGPTHTEIMCTAEGPRLIEVNAGRFHAQHFYPIVRNCLGYDALTTTLDGFFHEEAFDMIPDRPDTLLSHGLILHLITSRQGVVENIQHEDEIRSLPSFLSLHLEAAVGDTIVKTVDIRTDSGYVLLQHDDDAVVQKDFDRIVELQHTIYEVAQSQEQSPQSPQQLSPQPPQPLQPPQPQQQSQDEKMIGSTMIPLSPTSNFVATDNNNYNGEVYAPLGTAGMSSQAIGQLHQLIHRLNQLVKSVNWTMIASSSRQGLMLIGTLFSRMVTSPVGAKIVRIVARTPLLAACYLVVAYGFGLIMPML